MIIPTRIITPPTSEPVSVFEVKDHLRGISHDDHDIMIRGLIKSAREEVEGRTGRALVQRTVAAMFQGWPDQAFDLPFAPLSSVTSVKYTNTDGDESTFSSDDYSVDVDSEPGRVVLGYSKAWPTATLHAPDYPVVVTYVAGYTTIPENIKTAIKFLVDVAYSQPPADYVRTMDRAIDALLAPYRLWSF